MDINSKLSFSSTRLDSKDVKILDPKLLSSPIKFGTTLDDSGDTVQLHVYDMDGNRVVSVQDLRTLPGSEFHFERADSVNLVESVFYTDPVADLERLGLHSGTYKSVYVFVRYYLSFGAQLPVAPWYIQDISTSRREVRVITTKVVDVPPGEVSGTGGTKNLVGAYPASINPSTNYTINKKNLDDTVSSIQDPTGGAYCPTGTFVLDLLNNNFSVVINQTVSGESLLFKFYKPLPDDIVEKSQVVPYIELARPIEVISTITNNADTEQPTRRLGGKNTNVFTTGRYDVGTAYQSWTDLLSTNPQTSQDLLDNYLNSGNHSEMVNIDYSDYSNFVHYSSAEERVRNFQYKLQLMEQYASVMGSLSLSNASGSLIVSQSTAFYDGLTRGVLNGFDGYENWLYWESGSIYSSSLGFGVVSQSTWPKSNNAYPYNLYSVSSSQAVSWFNNQVSVANTYDRLNAHNLLKTAPFHIREDEENNQSYLTFLQMMGHHYDIIWTYAKGLTQRNEHQHKLNEGAAKDVIWDTMKSFGMDLTNGKDVTSLWKYAFGTNETSGYENNVYKMSYSDSAKEIWKRLFNNLSYLLKTKGTVRGIKALITCYGIPSTILRVKEYGGPDPDLAFESSKYLSDEFTYQLNFNGTQIVSQSWLNPTSVEFRFYAAPSDRTTTMTLLEGALVGTPATNFRLSLAPNGTRFTSPFNDLINVTVDGNLSSNLDIDGQDVTISGQLLFEVSGGAASQRALSSEFPAYNKQYWSVLLERTQPTSNNQYNLWAKQHINGRINFEASFSIILSGASATAWASSDEFRIGGSKLSRGAFVGTMQEFRLWNSTLDESVFENHVLAPLAYNGNTYSSSYYDLALRWRMNQSEWYSAGGYNTRLFDSNPGQSTTRHGVWSGSNSAGVFATLNEINYYETPDIGFRRMSSNKVRVDTYVSQSGNLNRLKRVTTSRYDTSPLDSNKVGVFLAPTEMINEDIIRTFAGTNYDDFIGSPLDLYKSRYADLDAVNTFYWTKYGTTPDIYTYMRVLSYFDKSLYDQIRKMLPARVDANVGFLIEQHMLERTRVPMSPQPSVSNLYYTSSVDMTVQNFVAEVDSIGGVFSLNDTLYFVAEVDSIGGVFSLNDTLSISADNSTYVDSIGGVFSLNDTLSISADNSTYIVSKSIRVVPLKNIYSYNIFDQTVLNGVLYLNSSSTFTWSATTSLVPPACDFWLDRTSMMPITASGAVTGYSPSHYIFHRQRATALENLWYDKCIQTINTTPDKGLPFESFEAPPNILVVVDSTADTPRLKVE